LMYTFATLKYIYLSHPEVSNNYFLSVIPF
jgi:hypothetical protein